MTDAGDGAADPTPDATADSTADETGQGVRSLTAPAIDDARALVASALDSGALVTLFGHCTVDVPETCIRGFIRSFRKSESGTR